MNAASGIDQPPEGAVSSNNTSRRTFLKGAALAGAAGLAAPLLASTSARASTSLILGIQAPEPWEGSASNPTLNAPGTWHWKVPGAVGCRSYVDTVFSTPDGCPASFPGITMVPDKTDLDVVNGPKVHVATKVVASIRPDPRVLLNPNSQYQPMFDNHIKDMILDGATRAANSQLDSGFGGRPKLTVWHEAGNLYTDPNGTDNKGVLWRTYGLVPGYPITIDGTTYGAAQLVRSMHVKMKNLCDQVKANHPELSGYHVDYGCIIYGQIDQMASDTDPDRNFVPNKGYPLDWYGIDVYYEDDPGWGRGNLVDYTAVSNYMNRWLVVAQERSGKASPTINVCECNANASNADARPGFFEHLAAWLFTYGGSSPHMLTFFPVGGGNHSVQWGPPQQSTIDALNFIQSTYG